MCICFVVLLLLEQVGVKRNAERYMFCFPRPWMRSGPESGNPGSLSVRLSPTLTFWPLSRLCTFWPKSAFLAQKVLKMKKVTFPRRNALLGPKSLFGPKGVNFHQESIGFTSIRGMVTKKCILGTKMHFCAKRALWAPKCVFERKSGFWSKNLLFGMPVGQVAKKITCM